MLETEKEFDQLEIRNIFKSLFNSKIVYSFSCNFKFVIYCRFEATKEVLGNAYSIMRRHFTGSWICWSKVPDEQKKLWWEEFKV